MARISPVEGRRASLRWRRLNRGKRRAMGQESTPLKRIAHTPRFLVPFVGVGRFVRAKTVLDTPVRALATQLVAELNRCAWCIDAGRYAGNRQSVAVQ